MNMFTMAFRAVIQFLANLCPSRSLRASLYRLYGLNIGKDVYIGADVFFDRYSPQCITLGDRSAVAARSMIMAHRDIGSPTPLREHFPTALMPVVLENDVLVFPGCMITPGVRIGHHSILMMGAVVHKDIPPYSVVSGAGFRIVRELTPEERGEVAHPKDSPTPM